MAIIQFISDMIIPVTIFVIILYGIIMKNNVYDDFVSGALDGMRTVVKILPTLVGLMAGVGVLRASGFLGFIGEVFGGVSEFVGFPSELVPLVIVRMCSSSAATGLVLDIFKEFGPDSVIGSISSVMMCCTETIFYTMSVYFMAAKVTKTRWTLAGALLSTVVGIMVSVIAAGWM